MLAISLFTDPIKVERFIIQSIISDNCVLKSLPKCLTLSTQLILLYVDQTNLALAYRQINKTIHLHYNVIHASFQIKLLLHIILLLLHITVCPNMK